MASVPEKSEISMEGLDADSVTTLTPVADVYNTFNEQVVTALNKNLTFSENFRAEIKTLSVKLSSTPSFATSVSRPVGIWVINCQNSTQPTASLPGAPYVRWEWDGSSSINVKQIVGLNSSDTYQLTLLIIAG
jgi:hypothetical protein